MALPSAFKRFYTINTVVLNRIGLLKGKLLWRRECADAFSLDLLREERWNWAEA